MQTTSIHKQVGLMTSNNLGTMGWNLGIRSSGTLKGQKKKGTHTSQANPPQFLAAPRNWNWDDHRANPPSKRG